MLSTRYKLHTCRVLPTSWNTPALAGAPAMDASHAKRSPSAASSPFATLATSARFPSSARCAHCGADHDHEDFYVLFHTKLFAIMEMSVLRVTVAQWATTFLPQQMRLRAGKQVRFLVGNCSPRA
jgi:hypothetical protein